MTENLDSRQDERELLEQFAALEVNTVEYQVTRDRLIEHHLPLVHFLARKFSDRGEPMDDLVQVGTIGLIKAIDKFDPALGYEFSTYASPTIVGEIKRHFRDKTWAVRVPRRLQELGASVEKARVELNHSNGHSPTPADIATHLDISLAEVIEALEAQSAYSTISLDYSVDDDGPSIGDSLGVLDVDLEKIIDHETLLPLLTKLDDRSKRILAMRFFDNMSQTAIAEELGLSQMHVSRILAKTLDTLRRGMASD